jgi:hypothetical protein
MASPKLSPKQLAFIRHYSEDPSHNGKEAYKKAYYLDENKPVPVGSACSAAASRLLASSSIQAELKRRLEEQQRKLQIATPDECLAAWTRDMRFDPADVVDADGVPLPVHLIPERARLSLAGCDIQVTVFEPANGKGEARRQTRYSYRYPEKHRAIAGLLEFNCGKAGGSREQILERIGVLVSSTVNVVQLNQSANSFGQDRARELLAMFAPKPADPVEPVPEAVVVETEGEKGSDETQ